jgi:lia operon protein LiaG
MKSLIKGMILFFVLIIVLLTGFLIYGLTAGDNMRWGFADRHANAKLISTQELSLDGISEIIITAKDSDVIFKETNANQITIKEYGSKRYKESFIKADSREDILTLTADRQGSSWFKFDNRFRYIEVHLPTTYKDAMSVQTNSGDITADYALTFSEFSAEGSSGSVELYSVHADRITLGASSGEIQVNSASGSLDAETSSGDISIEDISGNGTFHTSSGDVSLVVTDLTGDLSFDTSSGTVKCSLPEDTGFAFAADTTSGDINTFFDDDLSYNKRGNNARGTVGGDSKYKIEVSTSSGDIRF